MSGICGVIDLQHRASLPPLTDLVSPLCPYAWFVQETGADLDGVKLAAVSLRRAGWRSHVAVATDGTVCLVDGEIYGMRASPLQPVNPAQNDAELVLHGWRSRGKEFVRDLNGSFAAIIWDPAQMEDPEPEANWERTRLAAKPSGKENGTFLEAVRGILFEERTLDRGWYDKLGVQSLLDDLKVGRPGSATQLLALAHCELGQRHLGVS